LLIHSITWAAVWAGHWRVAQRKGIEEHLQVHLLFCSAAGLAAVVSGAGTGLAIGLQQGYDGLFDPPVTDGGYEAVLRALIIFGVGVPVWWWYWVMHARHSGRSPAWLVYVLLLGVLGGVVAVVSSVGVAVFGVVQWFVGDPASASSAEHFRLLPAALGAGAVGGAGWAYHRAVLGDGARQARSEVERVYDHLLSGAGLLVAAGGLVALITVALDALGQRELDSSLSGNTIAVGISLVAVGGPLWRRYWSAISRHRRADPEGELRSVTRRVYLFLLFGATGAVAVVGLIVVVFIALEDALDGTFGSATISSAAVAMALLATAAALAWYHFDVFRRDRSVAPGEERPALREVILVCRDGEQLAAAISARTGATVRVLRVEPDRVPATTVDDLLEALCVEEHEQVVIVPGGDAGYDVLPVGG
jgi:hypothetical protein